MVGLQITGLDQLVSKQVHVTRIQQSLPTKQLSSAQRSHDMATACLWHPCWHHARFSFPPDTMAGVQVEGLAVLQLDHLQIVLHLRRQTILCPIPLCRHHTGQRLT